MGKTWVTGSTRRELNSNLVRGAAGALLSGALGGVARADHHTVVYLATLEWPPYVGEKLERHGWVAEAVRAAFSRRGFRVELRFLPWARGLLETREGNHDGIFPTYIGPRRQAEFILSRPLPAAAVGLFARVEDVAAMHDQPLATLARHPVGVVRGYLNHPDIDDVDGPWRKDEAPSDLVNLRKLAAGRVDLAVCDHLVARHLIRENEELQHRLAPVRPPFHDRSTVVGFSRNTGRGRTLVAAFDAGLRELEYDGSLAAIVQHHGLDDIIQVPTPAPADAAAP